jgi:proteasome lid subunit RPN8/RPN11
VFTEDVIEAIKADAIERFPHESCGVVVEANDGSHRYVSFPNTADDPYTSFHIDERSLLPLTPSLRSIVHSHPNGPDCPSATDMRQQLAWDLPFGIVSTDGVGCLPPFFWGGSIPRLPLLGRGFRHGVTDCYALIKDYFDERLNVKLGEHPRDWDWWTTGEESLYETNLISEGFFKISERDVREHDCFMARLHAKVPNHAGVYVGKGLIMHHLTSRLASDPSRLSAREPVGAWQRFIRGDWYRHESQRDA